MSEERGYLNFDLLIEPQGAGYRARLLDSPAGMGDEVFFHLPFNETELDAFLRKVGRSRRGERVVDAEADVDKVKLARAWGEKLFHAVLGQGLYGRYCASLAAAQERGQGLRLRLRLVSPGLNSLPWEYLCEPGGDFLALSTQTPVVRYFESTQSTPPLVVGQPLVILAVIASPADYPPLDVEAEWRRLQSALRPLLARGLVTLDRLEAATLSALQRRLRAGKVHILHSIGHGSFDPKSQEGLLLLENESGHGRWINAQALGALLHDHEALRLAVLNACEGARSGKADPLAGAAQSLLRRGLPAVIAMQFEITDQAAIAFSSEFYSALADGYPVEAALAEARKAIHSQNTIEWATPVYYSRIPDGKVFDLAAAQKPAAVAPRPSEPPRRRARCFIGYKRRVERDRQFAQYLYDFLTAQGQEVFIDLTLRSGDDWLQKIDQQLKASDYLIVLLSEASADSEMMQAEVRRAYEYRKLQGRPRTLPVRLAYQGMLPYALDAYIEPLQYIFWHSAADNQRVAQELLEVIAGQQDRPAAPAVRFAAPAILSEDGRPLSFPGQTAPPLPEFDPRFLEELEAPGGALKLSDRLYIERKADERLKREILKAGSTTTIRASRQTGKTSLLARGLQHARLTGNIVNLDLQAVAQEHRATPDVFFLYLANFLARKLHLPPAAVAAVWQEGLGPQDKLTRLLEEIILPESKTQVVLALDEADRILEARFASDFFALLRAWHNNRALDEVWRKLNIVLVISTEPYLLIADPNQSPFNVGLKLELEDFNEAQVQELNRRHASPVGERDLASFMEWFGGHPYLARKALYTLVVDQCSWAELTRLAASDQGPFADHLRRQHWLLRNERDLQDALRQVLRQNRCSDDMALFRLLRAGLVKGNGECYTFRCGLYERYFKDKLA